MAELLVLPDIPAILPREDSARLLEVLEIDAVRHRLSIVEHDEGVDTAARPGGRKADDALGGVGAEVDREVGDDEEAERLGDLARLFVVLGERGVLVAQEALQDRLHLAGQIGEDVLDLLDLGPDTAVDEGWVLVPQVHEAGEVLAAADRIDDRATDARSEEHTS